jgi:hypothetical protein
MLYSRSRERELIHRSYTYTYTDRYYMRGEERARIKC